MTIEEIELHIENFKISYLPENFTWRKNQKEIIIQTLKIYYDKSSNFVILDCPTGSGKSIIAMCISYVLNQDNLKGYILASDIALQEQYEKDIKSFKLRYGSVKGVDNYLCTDNLEKHSLGTCKIKDLSPRAMKCYSHCPYFNARDFAANSNTAVLNYAYWLIMMNYVYEKSDTIYFDRRDFTICDEAHKILPIVQNHYSPKFDKNTIDKLYKFTEFLLNYKFGDYYRQYNELKNLINKLYKEDNNDNLHDILLKIETIIEKAYLTISLKEETKKFKNEKLPKSWRVALNIADWIKDLHCKIEDYNTIIKNTSTKYLIKNPGIDSLVFNCLDESYLMQKYFHNSNKFTVLMSATFADASKYAKSLNIQNAKYIKLPSNFDFTNSPIFFYNKRKMSYNKINENLPWLYKNIEKILDENLNHNGIIHSVSYDLALKIYQNVSDTHRKRLLVYNGTEEKRQVLDILINSKNLVLMGPSLLEGLDLKDDLSRFQIFAKVPYLSLSDKYVLTKMNIDNDWYREQAILSILQGVGRSVRSANDWAKTYILDAGLSDLVHYNRKSFPMEFLNRIVIRND